MRSGHVSGYPLLWVAATALLALQLPVGQPAFLLVGKALQPAPTQSSVAANALATMPANASATAATATTTVATTGVATAGGGATEDEAVAKSTGAAGAPATVEPSVIAAPAPSTPAGEPNSAQAPVKAKPLPPTLTARINLTTQTMVVQAGAKTLHSWKVSSGAPGYATPPGTFKPGWMAKMWHSRQYDDAPMPHSVFFNGGIAVHGTTSLHNLGRAASHGCVRLSPANAERFYKLVSSHGMSRTRIVVHGSQPFSDQTNRIAKLRKSQPVVRSTAATSPQWYMEGTGSSGYFAAPRVRSSNQAGRGLTGRGQIRRGDSFAYDGAPPSRRAALSRTSANTQNR